MEQPILTDKNTSPTEATIFPHIERTQSLWLSLFERIRTDYPDMAEEWRYYNDGKCWLMKMIQKKKTVFWLAVLPKTFRVTFYFPEKARDTILKSSLSDELKEQCRNGKLYNKIRGVSIVFKDKKDVAQALLLIELKKNIK